ncbi:hypothetical protein ABIC70_001070 [Methylobacterium sp. 1973]
MPAKPFNSGGWRTTGRTRVRTGWFGFAVVEAEREYMDGRKVWARLPGHKILSEVAEHA